MQLRDTSVMRYTGTATWLRTWHQKETEIMYIDAATLKRSINCEPARRGPRCYVCFGYSCYFARAPQILSTFSRLPAWLMPPESALCISPFSPSAARVLKCLKRSPGGRANFITNFDPDDCVSIASLASDATSIGRRYYFFHLLGDNSKLLGASYLVV